MENGFYNTLPYDDAVAVEQAARLMFELRENRRALLRASNVADEADLLAGIRAASLPEHPGYERYLSACILSATRQMLRHDLSTHLADNYGVRNMAKDGATVTVITPPEIRDALQVFLGPHLVDEIHVSQDALLLRLDNETAVDLRVFSASEYSFAWQQGAINLRIDTAPVSTAPSHLHAADGSIRPDPLTVPGRDPLENIHMLLDAILRDPLLANYGSGGNST